MRFIYIFSHHSFWCTIDVYMLASPHASYFFHIVYFFNNVMIKNVSTSVAVNTGLQPSNRAENELQIQINSKAWYTMFL